GGGREGRAPALRPPTAVALRQRPRGVGPDHPRDARAATATGLPRAGAGVPGGSLDSPAALPPLRTRALHVGSDAMSEYVVITGLSGGGRTEASRTFEDLGWFTIDNLPASLIPKVADLAE